MDIKKILDENQIALIKSKISDTVQNETHEDIILKIIKKSEKKMELTSFILDTYKSYKDNEKLMNKSHIDFEKHFTKSNFGVEDNSVSRVQDFNNEVRNALEIQNINKLKNKITPKNMEHIFDERTEQLLREMSDQSITVNDITSKILNRIRTFKNSEELNEVLVYMIEEKQNWNPDYQLNKLQKSCIEGVDYNIEADKDGVMLVDLITYKAANTIGSKNWDISRENMSFLNQKSFIHIEFKAVFDFNKSKLDPNSMVLFSMDINQNPLDIILRDNTLLDKSSGDLRVKKEKLISELIEKDVSLITRIRKIKDNKFLSKNALYKKQLNPSNFFQAKALIDYVGGVNEIITLEQIESNPDLFNINKMNKKELKIIDDLYLLLPIQDAEDLKLTLSRLDTPDGTLNACLDNDLIRNQVFNDNWMEVSEYLISKNKNEELLKFLDQEPVIREMSRVASISAFSRMNVVVLMLKSDSFSEYINEGDNSVKLNNIMSKLKSQTDQGMNETIKFENLLKIAMLSVKNENEYNKLIKLFPEAEDMKSDFKDFSYNKHFYFKSLNLISPLALNHFDFKDEGNTVVNNFVDNFIDNSINILNSPFEMRSKKLSNESNNENFNNVVVALDYMDKINNGDASNIFKSALSQQTMIKALNSLSLYRIGDNYEKDNVSLDILIEMRKRSKSNEKIDITTFLNNVINEFKGLNYQNSHSSVKTEGLNASELSVSGFEIVLMKLNKAKLVDTSKVLKYIDESQKDQSLESKDILKLVKKALKLENQKISYKK